MATCRKCPGQIRFCKTADGNWMPIDVEPNADGNLVMDGEDDAGCTMVRSVDLFTPADAVRFMPHWATCPAAAEFRGKK